MSGLRRLLLLLSRDREPDRGVSERRALAALGYGQGCRRSIDVGPWTPGAGS